MSNVINLFGVGNAAPAPQVPEEAPTADADVRQEGHIEPQPVVPQEPKPPVYVRVRADVFQDMLNALVFYAGQGWDQGNKARAVINDNFAPEKA